MQSCCMVCFVACGRCWVSSCDTYEQVGRQLVWHEGIVTAAAACMVCVCGGLLFGGQLAMQFCRCGMPFIE